MVTHIKQQAFQQKGFYDRQDLDQNFKEELAEMLTVNQFFLSSIAFLWACFEAK